MSKKGRLSRFLPKFLKNDSKTKSDKAAGEIKGPSCVIIFLDDSEQTVIYKNSWKGQTLFDQVCDQINLSEKVYFGLRFVDACGQAHWLDLVKSVSSQLKGCSPSQSILYFGVKFYAADPCKLREEITRYLFFLQVKKDILQGRLPVSFQKAAELCAYAVQSELGDFDSKIHTPGYVSEFSFIPNQTEELEATIAGLHRRCQGASPVMAEQRFLEKVKWLEMYGADLHPVQDSSNAEYFLGLTPAGIVVYKHRTKIGSHFWPRVTKVSRKGKVFTIRVKDKNNDEHMYAFELSTKSACKHLWKCCVEHRTFFSERSERQATYESRSRNEPSVHRVPSRRKTRRVTSDSKISVEQMYQDQYSNFSKGQVTIMGQPEPVRTPRHRSLPELHGRQSPRSVKSAPWESKFDHGLYTSGHDSPASGWQTSFVSAGSDSESGISHRKRYFPNRKTSDNESDVSLSRRRRHEMDSDSGSEVSFTNTTQNRKNFCAQRNLKTSDSHISIPSVHSAPVGEVRQRRRRRRSKSPGNSKRPPEELRQHIEYDLVDTEGMTNEELRDIPFTKVETKASLFRIKYSPKFRQKIWASRRKSFGDADRISEKAQREGSGANLSRQNSNHTDPVGRHVQNKRSTGEGQFVGNEDVQNQQKMISPIPHSQEIRDNSSSGVYQNHQQTSDDYSSSGRKRKDRLNSGFSDGERNPFSKFHGREVSYNEHTRKTPSEQIQQSSSYENNYGQNWPEYTNYKYENEGRNPNSERQRHLYPESDRNGNGPGSYSQSAKQNSHNFSRVAAPKTSNQGDAAYCSRAENSGPQNQVLSTLYTDCQSTASSPRESSTPRYSEMSNVASQRGTSSLPRYSETNSHRETSTAPRYSEMSYMSTQRGIFTPSRASARIHLDQQLSPLRSGAQFYEEQELPRVSYSGQSGSSSGYGGSQNCQSGSVSNTPQSQMRYIYSSHHSQFGDKQQGQMSNHNSSAENAAKSPYSHNSSSNYSREMTSGRQGYTRSQQSAAFRSDLVTQL